MIFFVGEFEFPVGVQNPPLAPETGEKEREETFTREQQQSTRAFRIYYYYYYYYYSYTHFKKLKPFFLLLLFPYQFDDVATPRNMVNRNT